VKACGVNFIDTYHRSGLYPNVYQIGREGSGIILKIGKNVKDFQEGDAVCWWGAQGSYCTHLITTTETLMHIPKKLFDNKQQNNQELDLQNFKIAAAIPLQALTAHYLCRSVYNVSNNDIILIHAGAGGTGGLLIQMCKNVLKAKCIITTVSNEYKKKIALEHGADYVIITDGDNKEDFYNEVMKISNNKGCNVVYDGVGKETWENSLKCVCSRGMLVLFGNASGPVAPINPLLLTKQGSIFLCRPSLIDFVKEKKEFYQRSIEIFEWIYNKQLKICIGKEYSLTNAVQAHKDLESRATNGKVLLIP